MYCCPFRPSKRARKWFLTDAGYGSRVHMASRVADARRGIIRVRLRLSGFIC